MKVEFNGVNKIINLIKEDDDDENNPAIEASYIYAEWKNWLKDDVKNMKYPQAMRSIGGDPLSSSKTIAPYYEVMNDWNIKPYDGTYILTIQGNLFGTNGRYPFITPDDGNVLVSMELSSNALAVKDNRILDMLLPSWDTDFENKIINYYDKKGNLINKFRCYDKNGKPSLVDVRKMVRVEE